MVPFNAHSFGMYHDTDVGCDRHVGPVVHLMTPHFESDTALVTWSKCSRRSITTFLE